MDLEEKYQMDDISFYRIRNRTEIRVVKLLSDILFEFSDYRPDTINLQDIYALALNKLPPHYVQEISIVMQNPVDDETVREAIREAIATVRANPT